MTKVDKIVLIHGNSGGLSTDHWFPFLKQALENDGFVVDARDFPDNQIAHENVWLPFLKDVVNANENTILIGHSSGAVAAMRYAEQNRIFASVLVGVNFTDLNDDNEKASGYYNHPWNWGKIKSNQNWILQFNSTDDPYIPISEARFIHERLGTEYYEFDNRGHFMTTDFPEVLDLLKKKLGE